MLGNIRLYLDQYCSIIQNNAPILANSLTKDFAKLIHTSVMALQLHSLNISQLVLLHYGCHKKTIGPVEDNRATI